MARTARPPEVLVLQVGDRAPAFRVQPVFGLPVSPGGTPLVVLFLRGLRGGHARATIDAVQNALPRLDAAGARVVAFTRSELEFARDFVPRHHVLFPIVADPAGEAYAAWSVGRDSALRGTLLGLRPASLRAALTALPNGVSERAADQLPAFFLVGADGRIRYARYATSVFEPPDLDALCAAVDQG